MVNVLKCLCCVCVRVRVCTPLVITACAASVVVQYWTLAAVGTSCYMNPKNAIWLLSMDLIHMYATVCSGGHAYLPYWVSLTVNVWWLCVYCYLCSTTSMCLHFVLDRLHHVICMHYIDTAFFALTLLVGRQEEHPACKNWVMECWCGYLSGARCRLFSYDPADATAIPVISYLV